MFTLKAMTGGETYAEHHLSNNDYYSVGETIMGQWMGRGAELLGLQGEVTMDQFDAVREGLDPATGDFLRQRHCADRVIKKEVDGRKTEELRKARNLYDLTLSAPKALSVLALEDPRVVEVHKTAVAETAKEMERLAGSYVRKDGASHRRTTANLVIARYDHRSEE